MFKKISFAIETDFFCVFLEYCVMSGKQYTQGQQWNEGCDKICVCDDASTGHYICNDR